MDKVYSILFVGDLNEGGRSLQRCKTLQMMGHQVVSLSSVTVPFVAGIDSLSLLARVLWKLKIPSDPTHVNRAIRDECARIRFECVWIDKGINIFPSTLKFIKKHLTKSVLVSCSEDDMFAKHSQSYWYLKGLKYYDMVFTTKTYNCEELKTIGATRTKLFLDAYDETVHRPQVLLERDRNRFESEVSFIGTFENDRAERIFYLVENGVTVSVFGNGWERWIGRHPHLHIRNQPVYGEDYVKAINGTKINLCFLRKINRDEVTSRSVEIPACGGFMLGERTQRHMEFFNEGEEAEFFDSNEEMLEKVNYYLANKEARETISRNGRKRCEKSGYSMRVQLGQMLEAVSLLN